MNSDECRLAFEALAMKDDLSIERIDTGEYLSRKTQEAYEWFLIGQSSRTESKPVTREGCGRWISEETLQRCLILAEDPRNEYEETKELVQQLRIAPEAGVVTREEWVAVPVPEFDREWVKTKNPLKEVTTQLEIIRNHPASFYVSECAAYALAFLKELPAPQSPVVPGVEKLDQLYDEIMLATDANASTVIGWAHRIKAIHAHLLATGGRESREDRYRDALKVAEKCLAHSKVASSDQRNANYIALEMIREALATTSPNDGSGRG